jgi:Rhodopirellula transposase DDE domain
MINPEIEVAIGVKYQQLAPHLNEKTRRLWAATEAAALGRGGTSVVARATGLSRTTIHAAHTELRAAPLAAESTRRLRRRGGGRKLLSETDATLLTDLESLVEPTTRGDPESPLRWTCKSTAKLAEELQPLGHCVSQRTVYALLGHLGYSLQSNRKTREGGRHPDRDAQFRHIATLVRRLQADGQPVISVDTKKKELIGSFYNKGREWQPKGQPEQVNVYDFVDTDLGKAIPYGVYDLAANQGWVSVGIDHDTAEFAVATIRRWWCEMGRPLYPQATELLVTADGGGSNGSRVRLWKYELQKLADELGLTVHVCHFPPGTSKWNKIEHRMFCHISQNWRGRPLVSREVVVNLISQTTTDQGLAIQARLDENRYPTGAKVSDEIFDTIALERDEFHGDWNYRIKPRLTS